MRSGAPYAPPDWYLENAYRPSHPPLGWAAPPPSHGVLLGLVSGPPPGSRKNFRQKMPVYFPAARPSGSCRKHRIPLPGPPMPPGIRTLAFVSTDVGHPAGVEPAPSSQIQKSFKSPVAHLDGVEPPTVGLEGRCSVRLSYGCNRSVANLPAFAPTSRQQPQPLLTPRLELPRGEVAGLADGSQGGVPAQRGPLVGSGLGPQQQASDGGVHRVHLHKSKSQRAPCPR